MEIDEISRSWEEEIEDMDKLQDFSRAAYQIPVVESANHQENDTFDDFPDGFHVNSSLEPFMNHGLSFGGGGVDQQLSEEAFSWPNSGGGGWAGKGEESQLRSSNSVAAMREMIFRIAAMQPVHIDPESVKPPKRKNVRISTDPQSVAARHRRERISERIRILQRLVPGGTKMDTASMLDEAIHYVKFLKKQIQSLERAATNRPLPSPSPSAGIGVQAPMCGGSYFPAAAEGRRDDHQTDVKHLMDC